MKKKILIILSVLAILFIITAIVAYLNKSIILNKVKTALLENMQSFLGRSITIGQIDYKFPKGFVIADLEIMQKLPEDTASFIRIKEISFNPIIFPFILKKNIMIPSMHITGLSADIVRLDKNSWNFSDIIESVIS